MREFAAVFLGALLVLLGGCAAQGRPTQLKVVKSSGFARLDAPEQKDVIVWREVPINFMLGGLGASMPR